MPFKTLSDDGEFKRVMHIGEEAAHGEGPGGRYYGLIKNPKPGEFKGYTDDTEVKGLIPYHGRYPDWQIETAKKRLDDPWYLSVRDRGLRVGEPAASRCRKAGITYDDEEKVQGAIEFCVVQQRDVVHRLKSKLDNNISGEDVRPYGPFGEVKEDTMVELGMLKEPYERHNSPYRNILGEIRDEAIVGVYDSYGVQSPPQIKRTIRMNIIRPFGNLASSHTLGDVSRTPSEVRKAIAEKTAAAVDAAIAEFDSCVKRKWIETHPEDARLIRGANNPVSGMEFVNVRDV